MNSNDLREKLIIPAVVGALYAALTMLLAPISYGNLQFRISEALCVLPVFFPYTSVGLFLGCALANMISAAGILDVVFGSLATLCAGLCAAVLVFYTLSYLPLRRAVAAQETRLREAQRVGFDTAIVPKHNLKMIDPSQFPGLKLVGVSYLREAINAIKLK